MAIAILMLTMAAGTITFSVVDAIALRPLPYGLPDRLVALSLPSPLSGKTLPVNPQRYFEWVDGAGAFESIGAARAIPPLRLEIDGTAESLTTKSVTANLFDVLGIRPAIGRVFGAADARPGGPAIVILSHEFWTRRFRADPGIVGRRLSFGQESREVAGVLPEGVSFPITAGEAPDLYVPYIPSVADRSDGRGFSMSVVGRLRPGVSVEQARADIERFSAGVVLPLKEQVVGPQRSSLLLILAAVGVLILVACVNVAILLLARLTTRARELAIREALGASRRRLALGLLLEGMLLSSVATAGGGVLSVWGLQVAKASLPPMLTRVSTIAINGRVLAASIVAAFCCAMVFGSVPAWRTARADLISRLKATGGGVVGGRRRDRVLAGFLVADISFVYVLLVATTLVVTSFILVTTADLGFDRRQVAILPYQWTMSNIEGSRRAAATATLRAELLARANAAPGVTHAAIVVNGGTPLSGGHVNYSITIPGIGETKREDALETRTVTPEYFDAMGMRLLRGRGFQASDRSGAPLVMLINDVAARLFFAGRDPVGQLVTFHGPTTIVGVLQGVHFEGPETDIRPEMYIPADQEKPFRPDVESGFLIIRTSGDARAVAAAVRTAIRPALTAEPGEPQYIDDYFRRLTAGRRFNAGLMMAFGVLAFVLGAIGVFGTMAYVVAQQVPEIGLRMTFGASPSRVLRSVLAAALLRVCVGVGIGAVAAWALSNMATAFLFGIRPTEPMVFFGVAGFVATVSLGAALVPAVRAARVDPLVALRQE